MLSALGATLRQVLQSARIPSAAVYRPAAVNARGLVVFRARSKGPSQPVRGIYTLDLLAKSPAIGVVATVSGEVPQPNNIEYPPGSGELAVLCAAIVGAALGFLWFNAPPAMVFMGDTGSLSMGGALGAIAVVTKHEIVLAIVGGLFVVETVSVIVQVASFKLTGRRVFRMAPLHHHFEKKGWKEPTIVIRFWIIAIILALAGLSTLKLR